MERYKGALGIVWNQDCMVDLIYIEEPWLKISRDLSLISIRLDLTHFLDLLLLCGTLDFVPFKPTLQLLKFQIKELLLPQFAILLIVLNCSILRGAETMTLDKVLINMLPHVV